MRKQVMSEQFYFRKSRSLAWQKRIISLFTLILIVNFNHNWRVASENTVRNFQYKSWQQLTKDSRMFENVKDSDIFISNNQNDAFETNAGSFYANTGIRLAYLFNTNSIFPDYRSCAFESACTLTGVREKSIATLANLTRGTFVPKLDDKTRVDDWVGINLKKGSLDESTIWAFDILLLTPTTYFSYLAPFLDDEMQAMIDFTKLNAVTITSNSKNDFGPAIANICLVQDGKKIAQNGSLMTYWKVPEEAINPSGELTKNRTSLDFREIEVGTCVTE